MLRFKRLNKNRSEVLVMSQDNSILSLLNIKDENIEISQVENQIRYVGGEKRIIKVLHGRLTYRLTRCPQCGFRSIVKNGTRLTKLRVTSLTGQETRLHLRKQRYLCRNCGQTCGAHTPIVTPNHSITNQVRIRINELARNSLTAEMIAKLVGVSATSVQRTIYTDRKAFLEHRRLPKILCFDEFRSVHSTFSFICIDAQTHNLVTLLPDRLTKHIVDYFLNQYSLAERQAVEAVTMDLNAQYQHFIHRIFPNAEIIIDRFHIVQLAGRALDQARLAILHELSDHRCRHYKMLKSQWRLFHRNESQLNSQRKQFKRGLNEYLTDQEVVDTITDQFPDFKRVYTSYQTILHAIQEGDTAALKALINHYQPIQSEMDTVISTFRKNWQGIKNACCYQYSNGPLEGIIRKIKQLKRGCCKRHP